MFIAFNRFRDGKDILVNLSHVNVIKTGSKNGELILEFTDYKIPQLSVRGLLREIETEMSTIETKNEVH